MTRWVYNDVYQIFPDNLILFFIFLANFYFWQPQNFQLPCGRQSSANIFFFYNNGKSGPDISENV